MAKRNFGKGVNVLWSDKKHIWGLPISFTTYSLVEKPGNWLKLVVETGFVSTHIEEFHLYKVDDVSVYESFVNKMLGVGNIDVYVHDSTCEKLRICRVKRPYKVYDMINSLVEQDKRNRRVSHSEFNSQR